MKVVIQIVDWVEFELLRTENILLGFNFLTYVEEEFTDFREENDRNQSTEDIFSVDGHVFDESRTVGTISDDSDKEDKYSSVKTNFQEVKTKCYRTLKIAVANF